MSNTFDFIGKVGSWLYSMHKYKYCYEASELYWLAVIKVDFSITEFGSTKCAANHAYYALLFF